MSILKEIIGAELDTLLDEALKGSTVKLADLSTGKYVGIEKLTAIETRKTELETQLGEANKTISGFKDMDIDGIKKAADDYKLAAETAKKQADERVAAVEYEAALKDGISGVKFSSVAARKAIFDDLKGKGLKYDKGNILGLDDAIKALQEADKGAFVFESTEPPEPAKPPLPNGVKPFQPDGVKSGGTTEYTIDQIKQMTPAQINENWEKGVKQALQKG